MTTKWNILNKISDTRLFEARAQLHQAVQLLAATGISYLEARLDDSHTSMFLSPETSQFLGQSFGKNLSFQVALNPVDLSLSVTESGVIIQKFNLDGISLKEAAQKLQTLLESLGLPENVFTMEKHYELPDYPVYWVTAFDSSDTEAFQVLANGFSNAYPFFEKIKQADSRVSDLLIWPHHFDLGLLITMDTDDQGNLSKSIGMGLSPGDGSYTAPYYYVTNWPAPTEDQIPGELTSAGKWHTEGWIGMVLPLNPITAASESQQQAVVETFLSEALTVAKDFSK